MRVMTNSVLQGEGGGDWTRSELEGNGDFPVGDEGESVRESGG